MEEFMVYVLYSESGKKTYVGFTSDLINRMKSHNYLATKGFTIKYRPWKVVHVEFFLNKSEAIKREKELKTGQGRKFIQQILKNTRA